MNRLIVKAALSTVLAIGSVGMIAGCQHKTEGERTRDMARAADNAADMIQQGEADVRDGEAKIARGETLIKQGNKVEGDRLVSEGKVQKAKGEASIKQGRELKP